MDTQNIRSREPLSSFIRYCVTHPDERFWQALRNWSGYRFIYTSNAPLWTFREGCGLVDTFPFEHGSMDEQNEERKMAQEMHQARLESYDEKG